MLYAELDKLPDALPTPLLTPPTRPPEPTAAPPATPSAPDSPVIASKRRVRAAAPATTEAQSGPDPEQLPLLDPAASEDVSPAPSDPPTEACAPAQPPEPPSPKLSAPLRLPVTVRDALQEVVATLAGAETDWAALPQEDGLFIPLAALAAREVTPPAAMRAMNEAGMLVEFSPMKRTIRGQEVVGVLLAARHVQDMPRAAADGER